jgi:hypothetical protein
MMKLDMICLVAGASLMLVLVLASAFIWITEQTGPRNTPAPLILPQTSIPEINDERG